MSFEEIIIDDNTNEGIPLYWEFKEVGAHVEGNVYDFEEDRYGNQRIVLFIKDDENGEPITTILPGHANLVRFNKKLELGDYIRVELKEIIPPKGDKKYPFNIYKVMKDPDKKLYLEEEEVVE